MRIAVLVGNPAVQRPGYTTTCLSYEAWRRGHRVGWVSADGLSLGVDGTVRGLAQEVAPPGDDSAEGPMSREAYLAALLACEPSWWDLNACELVLMRLLARPRPLDEDDGRYETFYRARIEAILAFATKLAESSPTTRVINDPHGVWRTHGKLMLAQLPERMRPRMLITRDHAELREFVERLGDEPAVLKPLMGHGGEDVFLLRRDDPNRNQILSVLGRSGYIVAQEFVPENPALGERRMLLLGGEPLRDPATGRLACYRRDPHAGDWRGNVHLGAQTSATDGLGPNDLEIAAELGPQLRTWGLDFVGLDFRGDKLLEINAFCPGGVDLVHRRTGFDPAPVILDAWERAAQG